MENTKVLEQIAKLITADNIQKYILGTKKSGHPRAAYDIIKDFGKPKKKKKKDRQPLYLTFRKKKKKKKKGWKF